MSLPDYEKIYESLDTKEKDFLDGFDWCVNKILTAAAFDMDGFLLSPEFLESDMGVLLPDAENLLHIFVQYLEKSADAERKNILLGNLEDGSEDNIKLEF